ncbi:hypothetical protein BDL97_05G062000 [Sphagnum fallax]|nr:hypothetical protein BDL97_05G062000 [Sphagnum fallax]KAH8961689.1 hypothetical protein BDL97_05G062000 [Sphagnum fallax]
MLKFAAERLQCFETLKLQRVVHVRKLMVSCSLSESNQEARPPLTPHPPAPPRFELQMQNVSKFYKDRKVVNGISMNIGQHEVVGLFGPNGAGKSTTFNIIVGREQPSSGCVLLGAIDITRFSLQKRARLGIGYMTQEPSVFHGLSVRDNIRLILQETGLDQDAHNLRIEELLEEFCLQDVGNTLGRALSGGERRRTELARALASNCAYGGPPKIVLIDEPFAGVDPIGVTGIQKQLRRLCEVMGMGILITDHNVNETLRICERAYMVHNGQVLASGKPDEILQDRYVQQHYLGREFRGW